MPLELDEKTHTYRLDGSIVPGVTEALRDVGVIETQYLTEEGRLRGSRVHRACAALIYGTLDWGMLDEADSGYLCAFDSFLTTTQAEVLFVEEMVQGTDTGGSLPYGGKLDLVLRLNGVIGLPDLKTGAVAPWCRVQVAAYGRALEQSHGMVVEKTFGLHLAADGKFKLTEAYQKSPCDFLYFESALRLWYGKRNKFSTFTTHAAPAPSVPAEVVRPNPIGSELTPTTTEPLPEEIRVNPEDGERLVLREAILAAMRALPSKNHTALLLAHFGTPRWPEVRLRPIIDLRRGLESLRAAVEVKA